VKHPDDILASLTETAFIERLAQLEAACFIGDRETLVSLERQLRASHPACEARFVAIDHPGGQVPAETFHAFEDGRRPILISASLGQEAAYHAELTRISHHPEIPRRRLLADLFVNHCLGLDPAHSLGDEPPPAGLAYAIITTPRTGSSYLCQRLESTGIAGCPREHLRHPTETLTLECGFDYVRLLRHLMATQTTPNGVFGTKLISHFLRDHLQARTREMMDLLAGLSFIRLKRRDVAAQAVSIYLARRTNVWHLHSPEERESYTRSIEQEFDAGDVDFEEIQVYYQSMLDQESWIDRLLDELGASPLVVDYDALIAAPRDTVRRILDHLGLDGPEGEIEPRTSMQRLGSHRAEEIKHAFEQYHGLNARS
jgi:trehalose 2-sulfotransferase